MVHKLLEKLPPETITIDPNVLGSMSRLTKEQLSAEEKAEAERKQKEHLEKVLANKKRKSKISKVHCELLRLINERFKWIK